MRHFSTQFCMTTPATTRSGDAALPKSSLSVWPSMWARYAATDTKTDPSSRTGRIVRPANLRSKGTSVRSATAT